MVINMTTLNLTVTVISTLTILYAIYALINTPITLNKIEKEYEKAFCDAINRITDIKLPPHNKNKSQFNPDLSKCPELR